MSKHKHKSDHALSGAGVSILDAIDDPKLFASRFKDPTTWATWRVFLAALFGLPLTPQQQEIYRQCTGRSEAPQGPVSEAWIVAGRRAGKSFILALCAVFLACFFDYRPYLAVGEVGTILIVARDRKQCRTILRFIRGLLGVPLLAKLVKRETADGFELHNHISIEIATASYRTIRGYTVVAALCDEIAHWPTDDAADPDFEVLNAIRPAMLTIPNAMLLCASSPFARRGSLWEAWRKHYGKDGDPIFAWQAATTTMNPMVPQSEINRLMEEDPARASAEYLATFRLDRETFIARELVDAAIVPDRGELPRVPGIKYFGFYDAASGSTDSGDSFTAASAHYDRASDHLVLDAVREKRPRFSPEETCHEFAEFFKSYGITRVASDHWAGDFPREQFRKRGVIVDQSEKFKADIYVSALSWLSSRRVELYNVPRMIAQLCDLERKPGTTGKEAVNHPPGGHDDIINAACGALMLAASTKANFMEKINSNVLARARLPGRSMYGGRPKVFFR